MAKPSPREYNRNTDTHVFFLVGYFSNFYPCPVNYKGHTFPTSEHAYMWEKANHFGDEQAKIDILNTADPKEAKGVGRRVKNFSQEIWNRVSYQYMLDINRAKYTQNPKLANYLIKTDGKVLVEANGRDLIWGVGLYASNPAIDNPSNWRGSNWLGKVLMQVRQELTQ